MNLNEVSQFIGTQWVYAENDCWAIVRKASKAVFGVEIHEIKIPSKSDPKENEKLFEDNAAQREWTKVDKPKPGDIVLYRGRSGRMVHCGIMIERGMILHCPGCTKRPEATVYESLKATLLRYPTCEFYRYAPHLCD